MSRDDIIRMAREAGWEKARAFDDCLACGVFDVERFAALVAAAEREDCADMADATGDPDLADAIRARGQA